MARRAWKYPWDHWFSRPAFVLRQGDHFRISVENMRNVVRTEGRLRGLTLRITTSRDGLSIKVEVTGTRPFWRLAE